LALNAERQHVLPRRSAEAQEPEAGEVGLEAAPARSHNGGRDAGLIVLNVARIYYMIS
jgi:hypothetical protein